MRRINVTVVARARRPRIASLAVDSLKVYVTAPAVDGKANQAVIARLADWFGVKPREVRIVRGLKSHEKVVAINSL